MIKRGGTDTKAKHKSRYDPPANHCSVTASLVVMEIGEPELFLALVTLRFLK